MRQNSISQSIASAVYLLHFSDRDTASASPISSAKIPPALDRQMDKKMPTNGETLPGVSLRNGPIMEDVPMKDVNGSTPSNVKRKVSRPSYAESESSDDDRPIVRAHPTRARASFG